MPQLMTRACLLPTIHHQVLKPSLLSPASISLPLHYLPSPLSAASVGDVVDVDLGTNISFICTTMGGPPSGLTFTWVSPMSDDPSTQITGQNTSILSIYDVGVRADGMYECTVGFGGSVLTTASANLSITGEQA